MAIGGRAGTTFTEINVTPLTDVFLVLLVIMILIAPLVNQAVLKVSPPGVQDIHTIDKTKPLIDAKVQKDGVVTINGTQINPPETLKIMEAIKAEQKKHQGEDLPMVLSSDENALHKDTVAVMDAAAGCNIKNMAVQLF